MTRIMINVIVWMLLCQWHCDVRAADDCCSSVSLSFVSATQIAQPNKFTDMWSPLITHISSLRFVEQDTVLLCGGREVWRWERTTGCRRRLATVPGPGHVDGIAIHPTRPICAIGWTDMDLWVHQGAIQVLRIDTGEQLLWRKFPGVIETSVAFSNDGDILFGGLGCLTNADPQGYQLWRGPSFEPQPFVQVVDGRWSAISPDGKRIVINTKPTEVPPGDVKDTFSVFDTNLGTEVFKSDVHNSGIMGYVFSPDGRWLAATETGIDQRTKWPLPSIVLWDFAKLKRHIKLDVDYSYKRNSVGFTQDGEIFGSVHQFTFEDRAVKLWSTQTGRELCSIHPKSPVHSVAFGTCQDLLALGHADGHVSLWRINRSPKRDRTDDTPRTKR